MPPANVLIAGLWTVCEFSEFVLADREIFAIAHEAERCGVRGMIENNERGAG
jgi:hypothetical protein